MSRAPRGQACPHCGSSSTIRTSAKISELVRDLYISCDNVECGHTWKSQLSAVFTISPSLQPNPKVNLPISPRKEQRNKKPKPLAIPPPTG